jgi:hypothetical protein
MNWSRASSGLSRETSGVTPSSQRLPLLALREVRESGLPAVFLDFGEALLYLDGQLFSLRDVGERAGAAGPLPPPLPPQVLDCGVGIEYGWRHLAGCACHLCWGHEQERAA